jgi:hypothetical protein
MRSFVDLVYPTELPFERGQIKMNFTNDGFHITSDDAWLSLHRNKTFHLNSESHQEYVVSMHQQLYCLDTFRIAYLSLRKPTDRPLLTPALYDEAELCLDQMRQNVMCHADLTLEPTVPVQTKNGIIPGSPGVGVFHRCRNWQNLESSVRVYL